jgi:sulfur-oxidizing protein SoxA
MQYLPVLYTPQGARPVMASWPAYRVSTSQFITLQWRMNDCYRQMRTPEPNFGSDTTVALIHFMTVTARGETYGGPGNKR